MAPTAFHGGVDRLESRHDDDGQGRVARPEPAKRSIPRSRIWRSKKKQLGVLFLEHLRHSEPLDAEITSSRVAQNAVKNHAHTGSVVNHQYAHGLVSPAFPSLGAPWNLSRKVVGESPKAVCPPMAFHHPAGDGQAQPVPRSLVVKKGSKSLLRTSGGMPAGVGDVQVYDW